MANRSFSGLIRRRGYDDRGRTGYQLGEKTLLNTQQQYDAAVAYGYSPPTPQGGGGPQPQTTAFLRSGGTDRFLRSGGNGHFIRSGE